MPLELVTLGSVHSLQLLISFYLMCLFITIYYLFFTIIYLFAFLLYIYRNLAEFSHVSLNE